MNLGRTLVVGALLTTAGCSGSQQPATRAVGPTVVDASVVGPWRDRAGNTVPDGMHGLDTTGLVAELERGPEHCQMTSAYFLWIAWPIGRVARSMAETREFVRDPKHIISKHGSSVASAALPADARDTGLHRGRNRLFIARDGNTAFVGTGTRYERWPRIAHVGCL